jgi:hypothetical protein
MSRKLAVLFLAMLVLAGAMGLKTVVAGHNDGTVMMANGGAPVPIPKRNGGAPVPIPKRLGIR